MQCRERPWKNPEYRRMLWVALCFTLTSAVYLSWLDRLVTLTGGQAADWLSMVAGYLFQAAGTGAAMLLLRKGEHQRSFMTVLTLFAVIAVPTLLTDSAAGVIAFGWMLNFLCGMIAGFYLYGINSGHKSIVFGGGYAMASIAVGLLYLIGDGILLHGKYSLLLYICLTAGLGWLTVDGKFLPLFRLGEQDQEKARPAEPFAEKDRRLLLLACVSVILVSLVKNLGFGFPSADIEAGLIPELSRIPYAAGLIAAGVINGKSRLNGMMSTVAALIIPFIMLGLLDEPVSSTVFWGLDFVFFGFFSVYRVVLFLDIAEKYRRWELSPLGLLLGRIGDAAGTGVHILLDQQKIILIASAAVLFVLTVFLLFRLHTMLYGSETNKERDEQAVFEAFCMHHDLSAREREIFRMLTKGRTNGEIAGELFITENTVKYHIRNIFLKTGVQNRADLQKKYTLALYPEIRNEDEPKGKIIRMM